MVGAPRRASIRDYMERANMNDPTAWPAPPALLPFAHIECRVAGVVSLGAAAYGERRYVALTGGTVRGPELQGEIVAGGVDWQIQRADSVLDIAAHYVIRARDGGLIEVRSDGMRHGPAAVMQRLARGEPVEASDYWFRTAVRFDTGASAWLHLNKVLAIASGRREAQLVVLDLWRVG